MEDLTYVGAYIVFPGGSWEKKWPGEFVEADKAVFIHKGYHVSASLQPFFIPRPLLWKDYGGIFAELVAPAVRLVTSDLDTIMGQLKALQTLAEMKIIHPGLKYKRTPDGREFKVYEGSRIKPSEKESLFQKVMLFKGIDKRVLESYLHKWADMAEFVKPGWVDMPEFVKQKQFEDKMFKQASVEGSTLKEALERAIHIYSQETVLRNTLR